MPDSKVTEVEGVIVENLPNTMFRVDIGGQIILCHLAGKMRLHFIRLLPGDKVRVQISDYDKTRGRVVFKLK